MSDIIAQEPLLSEDESRLTIKPTKYHDIWEMYKAHEASIWHAHQIKYNEDKKHWNDRLSDDEKHFIKHVIAFFASSDLIVSENLATRFMAEVKIVEAKAFYGFQNAMENIHSEVYSDILIEYVEDNKERDFLMNAVKTIPCIKKKADWAFKWIESNKSFAERLIAFAIFEGVFFSGAFCCIFWLQQQGKMPGLAKANEYISRDEGVHTDFACLLYKKYIVNKIGPERIEEIFREAVALEIEFINDALPCKLLGMNSALMATYIKYVANRLVKSLGHAEIYPGIEQPFDFMDRLSLINKQNFFEDHTSEYSKAGDTSVISDDFFSTL